MREHERRLIVVESDHGAGRGWAKISGTLFVIIMAIGVVDHTLTVLFTTIATWFR
jgi:hypothetical protein